MNLEQLKKENEVVDGHRLPTNVPPRIEDIRTEAYQAGVQDAMEKINTLDRYWQEQHQDKILMRLEDIKQALEALTNQ